MLERRRFTRKPAHGSFEYEIDSGSTSTPGTWMNGVTGQLWLAPIAESVNVAKCTPAITSEIVTVGVAP